MTTPCIMPASPCSSRAKDQALDPAKHMSPSSHAPLAGTWEGDMMHGDGSYYYANGDIYAGTFSEGKKHGKGMYYFKVSSGLQYRPANV